MNSAFRRIAVGLAIACSAGAHAQPQDTWPSRPIRMVVPFPAGGGVDVLSRYVADALGPKLGQSVVVENRTGAATVIAAEAVANAAPDGYTLLVATTSTLVSNRFQFKKLRYDPDAFVPVSLIGYQPLVILANQSLPATDLKGLIGHAKKHPGALSFASFGNGSLSQLSLEMLKLKTGTEMTHIPFKGAAEALPALIGNQVQVYADTITSSVGYIRNGRLKALATTGAARTQSLPEVPTVAEQGFAGFDMASWAGIVMPRNAPKEAAAKLQDALASVLASKEFKDKLLAFGQELPGNRIGAGAFAEQIKTDLPKIRGLFRAAGIEPV
ncbi:Bug family tripartite tricarboxylate transporter substrate binding protein [Comamonas endophytica]|uniref:Tripartite tricarboxylate transporter substrate binding protein n=1 Tax=Comamonas endophytica TaxID=2949090 RepID=A0ABY6G9B7_9BURK|nr:MULTISPECIES: tripartite tricarboxylate transporter substrate binding protein [unclassified Acidovorax]MCD2514499.1 tripartite tricarboxylate transporter substrate binding protein [Acidovorax sp. D4N7]UYG51079.1 tripartite tricarboxylate transporter substrate binding protein [Acidovorax sp. 5MLIR]